MNADLAVFFFVLGCLLFGLGWETRGWSDSQAPKIEIRRVEIHAHPALQLIPCPVSDEGIAEWKRTCRARERNSIIKPKGTM